MTDAGVRRPSLLRLAFPGIAFFLLTEALVTATAWYRGFGQFSGADSYMRLARVLECRGGIGCPGGLFTRSNVPYGEVLHWPFLMDRILLVLAAPFRLFSDPRTSVIAAGYLIGPILGVLAMLALTGAARTLLEDQAVRWVPLLASVEYWVLFSFSPVRPDHHGLELLLFLVALVGTLHLMAEAEIRSASWLVGIVGGVAVWVGTDGLVWMTPILAALSLLWIVRGGADHTAALARIWSTAALVLVFGLLVDGPQPNRWAVVFDRFSVVHLTAFVLGAAFWSGLVSPVPRKPAVRAVVVSMGAVAASAVLVLLFPGVQQGFVAGLDPRVATLLPRHAPTLVPVSRLGAGTRAILSLGGGIVGLVVGGLLARSARPGWAGIATRERHGGRGWALVAFSLLWFLALSQVNRGGWVPYVQVLAPFGLAALLARVLRYSRSMSAPRLVRAGVGIAAVLVVFLWPLPFLAVPRHTDAGQLVPIVSPPGALVDALSDLRGPDGRHARVLAPASWGPELLFRADVDIVDGPYEGDASGMRYSYRLMSTDDLRQAVSQLRQRGIDFVTLCTARDWDPLVHLDSTRSFYHTLAEGRPPPELRPVPLPRSLSRYRIYRVLPAPAEGGPDG